MDKDTNLFWLDFEMTGLDEKDHVIIEVGSVVTDKNLNIIAEGPVTAINQSESELLKMDEWNINTHTKSGLIDRVRDSKISLLEAENLTLEFAKTYVNFRKSPLCGASIHTDRRFMTKYMKDLDNYLHYRIIDVSGLRELCYRWYPELPKFEGNMEDIHEPLNDIYYAINSLKYLRENIFIPQKI